MARAMHWSLLHDHGKDSFLVVNVGCAEWNFQVRDLAQAASSAFGGAIDVSINASAPPDKRSYQVNFSRFRALAPNHQPVATVQTTIQQMMRGRERGCHFRCVIFAILLSFDCVKSSACVQPAS